MRVSPRTGALMPHRGFSRWQLAGNLQATAIHRHGAAWRAADGLIVISTIDVCDLPGTGGDTGPTFVLSVGQHAGREPRRPTGPELMRAINAFELDGWDEDNHFPGVSRHLFIPVDERHRRACECKITETTIVDPADGYAWTTDDRQRCRGCQYVELVAGVGKVVTCPLHS